MFRNESSVKKMGCDLSQVPLNRPFGHNQDRNSNQGTSVSREVIQEGDSHAVPDRESLHSRENEQWEPRHENGERRSSDKIGRLVLNQAQPLLKAVRGPSPHKGETRSRRWCRPHVNLTKLRFGCWRGGGHPHVLSRYNLDLRHFSADLHPPQVWPGPPITELTVQGRRL